ncbi:hypothetical protein ACFOVU_19235 [Nocardiopsis sediminis]|uniref:Winged helix DNA-binding domain-containing protein n=1 Tax=Nocardiopsis sediminis TaxID=1778267 RepID=A0ABV8FQC9_9ACTN
MTAALARVLAALLCPPERARRPFRAATYDSGRSIAEAALRAALYRPKATGPLRGVVRRLWQRPRVSAVFDYPGEPIGCWHVRHDSAQPALVRPYLGLVVHRC